jgi:hypothetical protein
VILFGGCIQLEVICVFQGDLKVLGAIKPNVDFYADNFTLRQLAEIEVSLLSETPLKLLSAADSFSGTKDDSGVTLGPCTVVGVGFFVELDHAVFNLLNEEASGVSHVLSDSSIKTIAAQYVAHSNTFSSVVYHPEEIRLNRLPLQPFIRDAKSKQIPFPVDTKEKLSAKTHTIDVVWDTKKLFSGKGSFEHNGNEKRHRQVLLGWLKKRLWLNKVRLWRIPFYYYHNVFTTPHEFNQLFAINASIMYPMMFRCVQKVLLEAAKREYGCQPGLILALHTWGQRMHLYVHIHTIMTAGGLSIRGKVQAPVNSEALTSETVSPETLMFQTDFVCRQKQD